MTLPVVRIFIDLAVNEMGANSVRCGRVGGQTSEPAFPAFPPCVMVPPCFDWDDKGSEVLLWMGRFI